ncbi:MAG: translation initiation factor IF-3 [Planctomycetes bacterium]|nr:translation initiation factor IF-3 [Planctomycetota bacterium]MCB9888250.1 translation initiation factor IF-3 [Planctomycetota bacterium]
MARPPQGGRSPRDPGPRVNHQIRIKQVRVIDDEGNQLGVMETADAQAIANTKGLDLVEIAPNQRPPVCRIMDFGKYKYETKKKEQANKKKQHQVQVKEVRVRPKIAEHDIQVKVKRARGFFEDGDKVQVVCLLRGREVMHKDNALRVCEHVFEQLSDVAKVEREPRLEGRRMIMLLTKK